MSIDMTGLARLGSVGLAKVLTEIPKGQAKEGIQFAFKIKKAIWEDSKYGYRYNLDVVVRTLDMQTVLGALLWKMYPSMLPEEIIEAIDCDTYDGQWYLVRTEVNPSSKADPPRTKLHLIDTQQGLDAPQTGPPKPAAAQVEAAPGTLTSSERGQPGAGGLHQAEAPVAHISTAGDSEPGVDATPTLDVTEPPATPCPHPTQMFVPDWLARASNKEKGFYCKDCGERVG